ncbi:hypothetical protein MTR_5g020745 [Medicago truncatula]|uniref:Uncharacterized protein n=1 Tax=Medicago truncatula TaxID=3880 RepID=A0A072UEN7_MEDTR|nr:hypothetical protein MTR_5g020745 [Medicago truncatula]
MISKKKTETLRVMFLNINPSQVKLGDGQPLTISLHSPKTLVKIRKGGVLK